MAGLWGSSPAGSSASASIIERLTDRADHGDRARWVKGGGGIDERMRSPSKFTAYPRRFSQTLILAPTGVCRESQNRNPSVFVGFGGIVADLGRENSPDPNEPGRTGGPGLASKIFEANNTRPGARRPGGISRAREKLQTVRCLPIWTGVSGNSWIQITPEFRSDSVLGLRRAADLSQPIASRTWPSLKASSM